MQVSGELTFQGPREQVWALLNNPDVLARCTPGCEQLLPVGPDQYSARVSIGLAAVKGRYEGTLAVQDKQEPSLMTLRIDMKGTTGFVQVNGRMALVEAGADVTRVQYDWDVQVGGPISMVGQRVLGGVAKWIIGEFFGTAQNELTARQGGGASVETRTV